MRPDESVASVISVCVMAAVCQEEGDKKEETVDLTFLSDDDEEEEEVGRRRRGGEDDVEDFDEVRGRRRIVGVTDSQHIYRR